MSGSRCSKHAMLRARQRGISQRQIDAVEKYADVEQQRGGGRVSVYISKEGLERLGPRTPEGVSTDRLKGLTLLQAADLTCVTVARHRRARFYRRPGRKWGDRRRREP
jgi:hypothetical protein